MGVSIRLKELRADKNLTQKELATMLGLSKNIICEYEKGRAEPSVETLTAMCKIFQCSADYLIGLSDDFGNVAVNADLSEEEKEILATYRALPVQRRKTFMYFVQSCKEELSIKNYKI